MPSVAPNTRLERKTSIWNLELGSCILVGASDSKSDWRAIQVRASAGTRPCHHDRGRSTMEWIGAFHDRTNRCCLGVARKQADQMLSCSAPSMQPKRGIDCLSERSGARLNADERDRTDECSVSWTIRRPVDQHAN